MAVAREAVSARHDVALALTCERSVVISANSQTSKQGWVEHGLSSWSLEAAVAARLEQGLQPARGRDRDGRLVNRELVLIGSAVEARRQAWPVEEGSRGSRAVAVRRSGTKASASTGRQSGASGLQRSSAPVPNDPTPPHPRSHPTQAGRPTAAPIIVPLPRANSLHPALGLRRPCATRPHPRAAGA